MKLAKFKVPLDLVSVLCSVVSIFIMIFEYRMHKKSERTIKVISDQIAEIENDSRDENIDDEIKQQDSDKTFIENRDS